MELIDNNLNVRNAVCCIAKYELFKINSPVLLNSLNKKKILQAQLRAVMDRLDRLKSTSE